MASEIIEPSLRTPSPDGSHDGMGLDATTAPVGNASPASTPVPRTGSADDLGLALEAKPDPLLGEFDPSASSPLPVAEATVDPIPVRSSAELEALTVEQPLPLQPVQPPGSFEAFGPPAENAPPPPAEAVSEPPALVETPEAPASGSFNDLASLVITAEPPARLSEVDVPVPPLRPAGDDFSGIDLSARPSAPVSSKKDEREDDDDYEDEPRGLSLGFVLLLSYASAVTIGLLYVLITGRSLKHSEEADAPPAAEERADPGERAKFSRRITPPPPIKPEHLTSIGKPVRIGSLEVTPVAVTSGRITLKHLISSSAPRNEGTDALKLRLKLKNVSKDLVFAPLDEAFLREREAGVTDTYIELPGGQNIEMHSLAVTSEWGIVGQEFKELKPGETLDTLVVSAKDALKQKAPEMTWRVRLRTGIEQTDFLGVRFKESEIKPGS